MHRTSANQRRHRPMKIRRSDWLFALIGSVLVFAPSLAPLIR